MDRYAGEMRYRLLTIIVMGQEIYHLNKNRENLQYIDIFWIWYPDTRKITPIKDLSQR